jgi:TrmH family RNA methyltransferase
LQSKLRRKEKRIVLEGVRLIGDAAAAGVLPEFVLYTPGAAPDQPVAQWIVRFHEQGVACFETTPDIMAHITDTQSPQGIIAVVPMPEFMPPLDANLVLILDGIADPGNLGTILRTAAAAGADVVILAPGCVDPYNPKVLRSGMGAHFRVPLARQAWPDIATEYGHLVVYLADAASDLPYYAVDWRQPAGLIIGGEARGAETQARQLARATIAIPMSNAVESLNAAMAAGVILFEIRRQRAINR